MSGEIGAAADVATGALAARAVEPAAGEGHGAAHGLCLNCGTRLTGAYCAACGQNGHVHRTMAAIGHDIAHGVFHFEGKMWRTLPMLVLHPGALTRRYIVGERARFVSPMAMFLFTVFLLFAVVANLPGWQFGDAAWLRPGVAEGMAQARTKLAEERAHAIQSLAEHRQSLAKARAAQEPDPERIARREQQVATDRKAIADLTQAERLLPTRTTFDIAGAPAAEADNWLDAKWRHARENPQLVLYKLKSSAYKYSWLLIPLSLPFIWLLFPLRRDVGFYDHAVFATYSLTFMSLFAILLAVLGALGVWWQALFFAGLLLPPFHIYKQLKYGYRLSRAGAVWRTLWMLIFALTAAVLFVLAVLYLGVAD